MMAVTSKLYSKANSLPNCFNNFKYSRCCLHLYMIAIIYVSGNAICQIQTRNFELATRVRDVKARKDHYLSWSDLLCR